MSEVRLHTTYSRSLTLEVGFRRDRHVSITNSSGDTVRNTSTALELRPILMDTGTPRVSDHPSLFVFRKSKTQGEDGDLRRSFNNMSGEDRSFHTRSLLPYPDLRDFRQGSISFYVFSDLEFYYLVKHTCARTHTHK